MAPIIQQIDLDLSVAMKSQVADRVGVLRLLKNSLKNEQIKLGHELLDDEAVKLLQREAKQRRDSIEAYQKGSRADLAADEQAELELINQYLPVQMDEAAINKLIDGVVAETGAEGLSQMGLVIGKVMAKVAGQSDGATVSRLVRQRLS